jgi:hypothetical protein
MLFLVSLMYCYWGKYWMLENRTIIGWESSDFLAMQRSTCITHVKLQREPHRPHPCKCLTPIYADRPCRSSSHNVWGPSAAWVLHRWQSMDIIFDTARLLMIYTMTWCYENDSSCLMCIYLKCPFSLDMSSSQTALCVGCRSVSLCTSSL